MTKPDEQRDDALREDLLTKEKLREKLAKLNRKQRSKVKIVNIVRKKVESKTPISDLPKAEVIFNKTAKLFGGGNLIQLKAAIGGKTIHTKNKRLKSTLNGKIAAEE